MTNQIRAIDPHNYVTTCLRRGRGWPAYTAKNVLTVPVEIEPHCSVATFLTLGQLYAYWWTRTFRYRMVNVLKLVVALAVAGFLRCAHVYGQIQTRKYTLNKNQRLPF